VGSDHQNTARPGQWVDLITYDRLRQAISDKGYRFFDQGDYNLNLIGIRRRDGKPDHFNDKLAVAFRSNGQPNVLVFPFTTIPGVHYLRHPMTAEGTAILPEGQHRSLWVVGLHQGRYTALVQNRPVRLIRDNDKDQDADTDARLTEPVNAGINLHSAAFDTRLIGKWSAGCQVIQRQPDFELLMSLCRRAIQEYGRTFSYTLINDGDLA